MGRNLYRTECADTAAVMQFITINQCSVSRLGLGQAVRGYEDARTIVHRYGIRAYEVLLFMSRRKHLDQRYRRAMRDVAISFYWCVLFHVDSINRA